MMDFARRLAPIPADDRTRAVPQLPSRFADASLTQSNLTPPVPTTASELPPANTATPSNLAAVEHRVQLRDRATQRPEPQIAQRSSPALSRESNSDPALAVNHTTYAGAQPPPSPHHAKGPKAEGVVRTSLPNDATSLVSANPITSKIAIAPFNALLAPTRRPMSEPALAARAAQTPPAPPVVHVTIDRIEVRAPATPPRTASAPRTRPAAPSVTLTDYLRQRAAKPAGAP